MWSIDEYLTSLGLATCRQFLEARIPSVQSERKISGQYGDGDGGGGGGAGGGLEGGIAGCTANGMGVAGVHASAGDGTSHTTARL